MRSTRLAVFAVSVASVLCAEAAYADDLRSFYIRAADVPAITVTLYKKAEGTRKPKVFLETKVARRGKEDFSFTILSSYGPQLGQLCATVSHDWTVKTGDDYLDKGRPSRTACMDLDLDAAGGNTKFAIETKPL